jgi:signal transduction histidine kinase/ActR/RegA family two-component response regulator
MTSIHDDDPGSPASELLQRLQRMQLQCAALAGRKDELELVLAAGRVGFCRVGRETRVLIANSQFKAEFGWAPDAQIGWRELEEHVHREDRGKLADAVRAAFSDGAEVDLIVRTELPDRPMQWIAVRGRTVSCSDDPHTDLILTSRNVSAENRAAAGKQRERATLLEHERKLREAAEAANRAKDEFLSVISHELRSPLNAILGWNRILALKRREDPEVASITPRIEQSAKAQLKMVNDLLDLGRVGTGKLKIEPRPVQLGKIAGLALDLARPAAAAKGIEIAANFHPGAGRLRADPDRLQQVVANLLSNAIKFTPSSGRILVTLRDVDAFTELAVEDTGRGIPLDLLPHVFDRFRQGDNSSTRHSGGLGLGLTLVREIVTLHGGSVSARSDGPGTGAVFTVRLPTVNAWPCAKEADAAGVARGSAPQTLHGLSILVVDDEMDARTVVAETLRLEGARVIVTDSAGSAFEQLQADGAHFDIIVTDIGMPDEDGYSLVRKLRALQTGRRMLAIAVTGYASKGDVAAAMDAGFDLHVPKPVDFDTFVPMVRRLAALSRQ